MSLMCRSTCSWQTISASHTRRHLSAQSRIPSEITLVQETGFARDTVRKAIGFLVEEQLVYIVRGMGQAQLNHREVFGYSPPAAGCRRLPGNEGVPPVRLATMASPRSPDAR